MPFPRIFRHQLALGFGLLALVIGLPSTFVVTQVYQDELIKDRGLALRDLAQAAAAVVGADLQERQREITLLAQMPLYRDAPLDSPAIHDSLTRVQRAYTRYSWIGLADAQGQVRNATGDLLLGADVSRRPWFQQGLTGPAIGDLHEALLLSKLLPPPPDGQTIRFIDFASPVHDAQGQVRGVLAAHAHWDWAGEVMRLLSPLQATQTGLELFIVNREGRILYPEAAGTPAQIPTALAADPPFLSLDWADAGPYLSALAPVPEVLPDRPLGWSIATRQPRAQVLAEVTGLRTAMMLLASLAVLFFAALAWWSAARFSRPLERLVGLAQRIEREDEVALPPVAKASTAEFQALDEALHAMATTLIQRRAELQRINRGLEAEIASRTADLRRSEARARAFMQTAFDGVVVIDDQSRILEFNPAAEALFGYRAAEIVGQPIETLMPPADASQHGAHVAASQQHGARRMGANRQVWARHKSGRDFPVEVSIGTLADGDQRLYVGLIRDITARQQHERDLDAARYAAEAANTAKSEFLAHMSHEIRTPMNAVLGLAQLLYRAPLTPDQHEMVRRIQEAGQSLLGILNDILDFSKIEAGQLRLESRPFCLAILQAKLDSLMGPVARGKGLALTIRGPAKDLGPLRGDALRLEQVLINLIGNAIKFTPAGEVAVTITRLDHAPDPDGDPDAPRLRFAVRDSGIGIAPEALARLFTPFTQADDTTTRRFGGTGLGLSICKRLVELMGGAIGADSQPGQGSTFWFELPFSRARPEEVEDLPAPADAVPAGPRLPGLRLLAVDDSPLNRDLVERALTREGAQVSLAADGQQALQWLHTRSAEVDAVLMDVQMPVMDGLTAMRHIRQDLGLKELPLLALSAGVLAEQQAAARAAGADAVLAKPLDLDHLVTTLRDRVGPAALARAAERADMAAGPAATRPAAPAPGAQADFPQIAGIDRVRAALSFDHDRDFFLLLLGRFLTDARDAVPDTRAALARGDRETAILRVHSLRGNAGNLGALGIMTTAAGLEEALQHDGQARDADLARLEQQLADLAAASAPWLQAAALSAQARAPATDPAPAAPLDPASLEALRDALARRDLAAVDLFDELAPALAGTLGAATTQALGDAIANLEFAMALANLPPLAPPTPPLAPVTAPPATSTAPLATSAAPPATSSAPLASSSALPATGSAPLATRSTPPGPPRRP